MPKKSQLQPPKKPQKQENLSSIRPPQNSLETSSESLTSKLDQVALKIEQEKAVEQAKVSIDEKKKQDLISSSSIAEPSIDIPEQEQAFVPDPMIVTMVSGAIYWEMKKTANNIFNKDLYPLSDEQQQRLEALIDKLARKHIPPSFTKYQQDGEVLWVFGGIILQNLKDIEKPVQAVITQTHQPAPSIPETPKVNVTVVTAEAPPTPTGVQ